MNCVTETPKTNTQNYLSSRPAKTLSRNPLKPNTPKEPTKSVLALNTSLVHINYEQRS